MNADELKEYLDNEATFNTNLLESNLRLLHASEERETAVIAMLAALKTAKDTIRTWHGETGWKIYDEHSPEMQKINAAIALGEQAMLPQPAKTGEQA